MAHISVAAAGSIRQSSLYHDMGQKPSSIGQGVGDLFYPDNPERRARARELQLDCDNIVHDFSTQKKRFDEMDTKLKTKMMDYLKAHGYDSLDQLDAKIHAVASGEALENWEKLQKKLGKTNAIEQSILAISGVATVAGASTVGALVLVGILSGPAGWAALSTIMTVGIVVGGFSLLTAIIVGKIQRDSVYQKLQDAIDDLARARFEAKVQYNRLMLLITWMDDFETFFSNDLMSAHPEFFDTQFQLLQKHYEELQGEKQALKDLEELDKSRKSWTDEDPSISPKD